MLNAYFDGRNLMEDEATAASEVSLTGALKPQNVPFLQIFLHEAERLKH